MPRTETFTDHHRNILGKMLADFWWGQGNDARHTYESWQDLTKIHGISPAVLSNIERGKQKLSPSKALRLLWLSCKSDDDRQKVQKFTELIPLLHTELVFAEYLGTYGPEYFKSEWGAQNWLSSILGWSRARISDRITTLIPLENKFKEAKERELDPVTTYLLATAHAIEE